MERQPSLPQPVLYEPDSTPLVSVCQAPQPPSAQHHQLLVVPVWEDAVSADSSSTIADAAASLLDSEPHLGVLNAASLGALASAIKLHGFTGKKVSECSCFSAVCVGVCLRQLVMGVWCMSEPEPPPTNLSVASHCVARTIN